MLSSDRAPEQTQAGAVTPPEITLAVWGMPEIVAAGERFTIKAGAKSSSGYALGGGRIEIRDAGNLVVASGCLGDAPWPGTSALFWTEIELLSPAVPGLVTLSAQFDAAELDLPHAGVSSYFSVAIVERPEHRLTVKVIAKETALPIEDAQVRLGPYRASTGPSGLAAIRMPTGHFAIHVWKAGYEAPSTEVNIGGDAFVQIEIAAIPEEDPDAHWKG